MSPHGSTSSTGPSLVCGLCVVQGANCVIQVWFCVVRCSSWRFDLGANFGLDFLFVQEENQSTHQTYLREGGCFKWSVDEKGFNSHLEN